MQVRTLVQRELAAALAEWDLLLSPAAPTTAYRIGEARCPLAPQQRRTMRACLPIRIWS